MAQRLDIDAGQLVKILQGKLRLPERAVARLLKLFELDGLEAAFFQGLVVFAKARGQKETSVRRRNRQGVKGGSPYQ